MTDITASYLAPLVFIGIITLAVLLFSVINRRKAYTLLFEEPVDDAWGINVARGLTIIMLISTMAVLLFEQDVLKAVLYSIPFVIIFVVSMFKKPGQKIGIPLFGTPLKAAMAAMLGVITTILILIVFNVVFNTASVLPTGSIASTQDILDNAPRLFYTVVMAPINEEFFFRAIVFYGALMVLKAFTSTRKLSELFPGPVFIVTALAVSLIFALFHIAFVTQEPGTLALLEFLSLVWILGMQLTGSIAFAIVAHVVNNALALQMTIPAIVLYILMPIAVIAGFGISVNALIKGKVK